MSDEFKYYKLEELELGMRVSIGSLSRIYGTTICLDEKSFEYVDGEAISTIVYIGNEDFTKLGIKQEDVCVVRFYDEHSELLDDLQEA